MQEQLQAVYVFCDVAELLTLKRIMAEMRKLQHWVARPRSAKGRQHP
jgi:hypothetical protein